MSRVLSIRWGSIGLLAGLWLAGTLKPLFAQPEPVERPGMLSDDELLEQVERQTFDYFWTGAEPTSGLRTSGSISTASTRLTTSRSSRLGGRGLA